MEHRLKGNHIDISIIEVKKNIGKKVTYLTSRDIDYSGRGYFFPRIGTIQGTYRRSIIIDEEYIPINSMKEIVLIDI